MKSGLDILPALCLRQALQDIWQMGWVDGFNHRIVARKREHGSRNLILPVRRQLLHRLKRPLQELGHDKDYAFRFKKNNCGRLLL
jgi:hypothetical protein